MISKITKNDERPIWRDKNMEDGDGHFICTIRIAKWIPKT